MYDRGNVMCHAHGNAQDIGTQDESCGDW